MEQRHWSIAGHFATYRCRLPRRIRAFGPANCHRWRRPRLRMWNMVAGRSSAVLRGHTSYLMNLAFSPDDQRIVTTSYDHTARVWSAGDGRLLLTLEGHSSPVIGIAFSPDGQRVVTASADHTARVWSIQWRSSQHPERAYRYCLGSAFLTRSLMKE